MKTRTVTVTIPSNASPVANFGFNPDPPTVNEPVTFTSSSTDADGNVVSFDWDFDKRSGTCDVDLKTAITETPTTSTGGTTGTYCGIPISES